MTPFMDTPWIQIFCFHSKLRPKRGSSPLPSLHNKTISLIFLSVVPLLTSSQLLPFTSDHNLLIIHSWENQGSLPFHASPNREKSASDFRDIWSIFKSFLCFVLVCFVHTWNSPRDGELTRYVQDLKEDVFCWDFFFFFFWCNWNFVQVKGCQPAMIGCFGKKLRTQVWLQFCCMHGNSKPMSLSSDHFKDQECS